MLKFLVSGVLVLLPLSDLPAQAPAPTAPTPVTITVAPVTPTSPPASFTLGPRHGHVVPERHGCTHTGGGNIDIAQPSPDTVVITMTGAAVAYGSVCDAYASQKFDFEQAFDVSFDNPKRKKAKLEIV